MNMIKIQNLTKKYGTHTVIQNMSLSINDGECIGIVGPNGAGKTTLIESICGLTKIDSGDILVDSHSILKPPYLERHTIGCCFQESVFDRFFNIYDTLVHNAMYHGMTYKEAKNESKRMLDKVHLLDKMKCYGNTLSGGMKKRFQLAIALVNNPEILILDEPTAGVDLGLVDEIHQIIEEFRKDHHKIVILTSHNINELAKHCTKLIFLMDGKIFGEYSTSEHNPDFFESEYRRVYLNEQ